MPVVVAGAMALLAAPAGAAFPGLNGELVFNEPAGGVSQVFSLRPLATGDTRFQLTFGATTLDPAWSPGADRLAFTSLRDRNPEVYVTARDGRDARRLTDSPAFDADPAWSPDGGRLVFTSERDGNFELYATGTATLGTPQRLTEDPARDQQAAWSPKGDRIAFESDRDGDLEIYTMRSDGTDVLRLTRSGGVDADAAWSPDGAQIAFASARDGGLRIHVMDADGSRQRPLLRSSFFDQQFPAWSPDGRQIAFNTPGSAVLYVADATGEGVPRQAGFGWDTDWGTLPPADVRPEPRETANLAARGTVRVQIAGAEAPQPLSRPGEIPLGSRIDATEGTAVLTVATTARRTGTLEVSKGVATVLQEPGAGHRTVLRMPRRSCASQTGAAAARLPARDVLRVRKRRGTKVTVDGRYSRGAGYGTVWTTISDCRRTVTIVREGTVVVTERVTGRRVTVRAGERHVARAR